MGRVKVGWAIFKGTDYPRKKHYWNYRAEGKALCGLKQKNRPLDFGFNSLELCDSCYDSLYPSAR